MVPTSGWFVPLPAQLSPRPALLVHPSSSSRCPSCISGSGNADRRQWRPSRKRPARTALRGRAKADELGNQLVAFAEAVLPRMSHRKIKRQLVKRLEGTAQEVLHPNARVYGFGSSFNGCGEASSDIDLVIYLPPEVAGKIGAHKALKMLADEAPSRGFAVLEMRLGFRVRVPIITLEMLNERQEPTGCFCDVSFQRLLPLHNTRLLRTYVELMPELAPLVVVVKRWAKLKGVAGTFEGFISTYSWTLAVIYYCQVTHGLPSLHELAARAHGSLLWGERGHVGHDVDFVGPEAAQEILGSTDPLKVCRLGAVLRGFFQFFSQEYDWRREVVSVRLGTRETLDHPAISKHLLRQRIRRRNGRRAVIVALRAFNIEDPIEIERNLNFALRPVSSDRIRQALQEAHDSLTSGAGLLELLGLDELPQRPPRRGRSSKQPWLSGFLSLGRRPPCECGICGRRFETMGAMLDHERSCRNLGLMLLNIMGG